MIELPSLVKKLLWLNLNAENSLYLKASIFKIVPIGKHCVLSSIKKASTKVSNLDHKVRMD